MPTGKFSSGNPPLMVVHAAETIEPLPVMTRDDRRLIFEKLNEVYVDEKTGYSSGFSDAVLAKDMGVPPAWVAQIRDENFGPAFAGNHELVQQIAEAKKVIANISKDLDQVSLIKTEIERLNDHIKKLMEDINRIQRDTAPLANIIVTLDRRIKDAEKVLK